MSIPTGTRTATPLRVGMVSTYPPTECGLATFTAALAHHVAALPGVTDVGVVRVVDRPRPRPAPEVVAELVEGSAASTRDVLQVLSRYDVAVLQHEYGIFGGPDGRDVLDLVDGLDVPLVTVLHTVLERPDRQPARDPPARRRRLGARGDDDLDRPRPAAVRLRHRPGQGVGGAARRRGPPRPGPRGPGRPARGPAPHGAHLGAARPGQGHRVGRRRDGLAARPRAPATSCSARPTPRCSSAPGTSTARASWPARSSAASTTSSSSTRAT